MKKTNIGILTFPINKAGNIPLSNLIDILQPLSNNLYLITGNDGYTFFKENKRIHTYNIKHEGNKDTVTRIVNYILTQLKMSYILLKLRGKIDFYIFFIGGDGLVIPMLTVKLLGEKVISAPVDYTIGFEKDIPSQILKNLEQINRTLSNYIILYSLNLIREWDLERYKSKIFIAHEHFLDFDTFKEKKKLDKRTNLIGFIGRLSEEKGPLNFVKAIPNVIKKRNDLEFLIGGNGQLREEITKYITEENLNGKVKVVGWIPHKELPDYLKELKLIVLPSFTEGIPNIMLEAMACGTPVLATPVGAIPDIITDEETGFIIENNSPECISKNIIRALEYPDPERIIKNARDFVESEFTYEKAVERYKKILENI